VRFMSKRDVAEDFARVGFGVTGLSSAIGVLCG
jgi:hypothetical protein